MASEWFLDLIDVGINKFGDQAELARQLGTTWATIEKWKNGSNPGIQWLEKLLEKTGGDIYRAFPNYQWNSNTHGLEVFGRVSAGAIKMSEENPDKERVKVSPLLWKNSKNACHTDASSPTILLKVDGDSMNPDYKNGEYLVCKRPKDVKQLPNGTPCIFYDEGQYTFKNLSRLRKDGIIGTPLNHNYDCILFSKSVEIPYIVLGKIDLG